MNKIRLSYKPDFKTKLNLALLNDFSNIETSVYVFIHKLYISRYVIMCHSDAGETRFWQRLCSKRGSLNLVLL